VTPGGATGQLEHAVVLRSSAAAAPGGWHDHVLSFVRCVKVSVFLCAALKEIRDVGPEGLAWMLT
jgi:hypothetical protein